MSKCIGPARRNERFIDRARSMWHFESAALDGVRFSPAARGASC
jgi:hypothetical protein